MDLILHNAEVITMDTQRPRAQAVAVRAGRIAAVGSEGEVAPLRTAETRLVDCRGEALLPAFIDAHGHLLAYAASLLSVDCTPAAVASIADIQRAVRQRAEATPEERWIRAFGYEETALAEGRHPNRHDLDAAAPRHPVRLIHRNGHACVLNSLALRLADIGPATEEPPGGYMERDLDSGEPTGLLLEMEELVQQAVPPLAHQELAEGVRRAGERFLSEGITALQDATHTNGRAEWELFARLRREGVLPLAVTLMEGFEHLGEMPEAEEAIGLRRGPLKIMVSELGDHIHPDEAQLARMVWEAHRAGRQVAIHAVEERAVSAATAAIAEAVSRQPRAHHRHRIEHCGLLPPSLERRLAEVEALVVTQPSFLYHRGDRYLARVAPEKRSRLYAIRSLSRAGVTVAAGSDCPLVPPGALRGVAAATGRRAASGVTLVQEEAIDVTQALRMHTIDAAYAAFQEEQRGSICPGLQADLVLLSADPESVPAEKLPELQVQWTMIDGEPVWARETGWW
ncbi:MAG: amidohydrolase [Dehalococcoidia bacterium]